MKKIFSLVLASAFTFGSTAQIYTAKSGSATFFSEAPLENIEATSTGVQSILNVAERTVAFIISIRSFRFEKDLMQEHFNEKYLESDKYPNATYSGKINEEVDLTKDGTYTVTSSGKITIHGEEKEITVSGTIVVSQGQITLESNFPLAVNDFKIEIPQLLFQNIADTVAVKVNVIYQP
jgi:hypothetical protein